MSLLTLYGCVGHSCTNLPTCLMSHAPMLFLKAMSKNYINHIDTYNDNSKSITINGTSVNINDLVRSFMAEDVEPVEEIKPQMSLFPCITKTAYDEGKAQQVENELRSASISAPKLVKAIRTNEALGYLDTQNLSSVELYELLDEHFGLSFKPRNFSKYRSAL